jgi:hypothetical protein
MVSKYHVTPCNSWAIDSPHSIRHLPWLGTFGILGNPTSTQMAKLQLCRFYGTHMALGYLYLFAS